MPEPSSATSSTQTDAKLTPRDDDRVLSSEELQKLELFGKLNRKLSVEKFPGSIVLRHFHRGEVVCRQGDRGHSAFYIVRGEDMPTLDVGAAAPAVDASVDASAGQPRRVATAYVLGGGPRARRTGWLRGLWPGGSTEPGRAAPAVIPNDGPADVDYETRQAPMFEGDVFGEMSCMTLGPRSATIVVDQDCYMVEFLRNIFDLMQRDDGYRQRIDAVYEQRVLSTHLRRLEFFRDLDDQQLAVLRAAASLEVVDPGTVICDEGDATDSVYVIRSGVVQVVRGTPPALRVPDVGDWPALARDLLAGEATVGTVDPPKPAALAMRAARAPKAEADPAALLGDIPAKPVGDARRLVWNCLAEKVQQAARRLAADETPTDETPPEQDRELVAGALNQLMRRREFVAAADIAAVLGKPEVAATVDSFAGGARGAKQQWTELEVRLAGSLVMRSLYPDSFPRRAVAVGPPHILAYLTRGDCFGEMAVVTQQPRQATCIAYDHPHDDPRRKSGRVELVRIPAAAVAQVLASSTPLRTSVERLVAERQREIAASRDRRPWDARHALTESEAFRDAGFVQGQSLLLIDLDRCTRCGDCVRACVNTHDDGFTRLFLDGPRFDRFLVPSACRQCLDPACMIGCPVGSIQRGDNGQIEIRDWCIGCGLCARQCPYDSIQMHDVGLIAASAVGWQAAPASAVPSSRWSLRGYRPRGWLPVTTPARWNLDLSAGLAALARDPRWDAASGLLPEPIYFRYRFAAEQRDRSSDQLRLQLSTPRLRARAWLNGKPIELHEDSRPNKKGEYEAHVAGRRLRRAANVLAVEVSPVADSDSDAVARPAYDQPVFSARLDVVPTAGQPSSSSGGAGVQMEPVSELAVVCDLCSSLPSRRPACVDQCPHEAAIRVNARFEFPVG